MRQLEHGALLALLQKESIAFNFDIQTVAQQQQRHGFSQKDFSSNEHANPATTDIAAPFLNTDGDDACPYGSRSALCTDRAEESKNSVHSSCCIAQLVAPLMPEVYRDVLAALESSLRYLRQGAAGWCGGVNQQRQQRQPLPTSFAGQCVADSGNNGHEQSDNLTHAPAGYRYKSPSCRTRQRSGSVECLSKAACKRLKEDEKEDSCYSSDESPAGGRYCVTASPREPGGRGGFEQSEPDPVRILKAKTTRTLQ